VADRFYLHERLIFSNSVLPAANQQWEKGEPAVGYLLAVCFVSVSLPFNAGRELKVFVC